MEYRRRAGETITGESPLLRDLFDMKGGAVNIPKQIYRDAVMYMINSTALRAGIRKNSHDRNNRKDIMLNHGFRKFFFKACGKTDMNPIIRELLMGHKVGNLQNGVTKLMMVYDATEHSEILKEYVKVIEHLTITEEDVAKLQLAKAKEDNAKFQVDINQFKSALEQLYKQGVLK